MATPVCRFGTACRQKKDPTHTANFDHSQPPTSCSKGLWCPHRLDAKKCKLSHPEICLHVDPLSDEFSSMGCFGDAGGVDGCKKFHPRCRVFGRLNIVGYCKEKNCYACHAYTAMRELSDDEQGDWVCHTGDPRCRLSSCAH